MMNAVFKYPGAKWSISDWIIGHFPRHHTYLEPFFGSGAVLFRKPRSNIETVNDLDENVVNLFRWMREAPKKLAETIYYTPYARTVYDNAFAEVPEDDFDRAVNFLVRLNMGHGYRTTGEIVGWKADIQGRERVYASQDWCQLPKKIMAAAERLRGVQIECQSAIKVIQRYNHSRVLIYCDPPYMLGTRYGKQYRYEMTDADHEELLATLKEHRGPVLISGYHSAMYDRELSGWHTDEIDCHTQTGAKKREVLWMNFDFARQISIIDYCARLGAILPCADRNETECLAEARETQE